MVRKIQVPEEISKPIRDAEIANQELLRNQQEKLRADGAAEKMEAETKINQRKQQIEAETAKKVAETQAQQRLAVAEIALQTARKEAEATLTLGKAEADVIFFKKEAEAKGTRAMTEAFGGGESLALYELAKGMAANTSFVWLPANEGNSWGGTLDDLQKWLIKRQHTQQAVQKPQPVGLWGGTVAEADRDDAAMDLAAYDDPGSWKRPGSVWALTVYPKRSGSLMRRVSC